MNSINNDSNRKESLFSSVNHAALEARIYEQLAPEGKLQGDEYVPLNPIRDDRNPGSFRININTGQWIDYATGEKGTDLVSLYALINGIGQFDACKQLAERFGISVAARKSQDAKNTLEIPRIPETHPKLGKPTQVWTYRNGEGKPEFYVYRFDVGDRKEIRPGLFVDGAWKWRAVAARRPIYNLDKLMANSKALVIFTEGEKAADAAAKLFPDAVAVTIAGGCKAVDKSDYGPLEGRTVHIWPDHDDAGRQFAKQIAAKLEAVGAHVGTLKVPPSNGKEKHKGWDAADALAEGWTPEKAKKLELDFGVKTFKSITGRELLRKEFKEPNWAVKGMIPEGVTVLAGKPKMGKSWMSLSLSMSIAYGGVALSHVSVDQGPTLYLALEDNDRRLKRRIEKLGGNPDDLGDLHLVTEGVPRMGDGFEEILCGWLDAHPTARMVVIDTLAKIRPATKSKDIYANDYQVGEALKVISDKYGVAILVVAHLRKMDAEDPLDAISGTTGLTGGMDGALILRRDRGRADASLYVSGRDIENEEDLALKWDQQRATWSVVGEAEEYRRSTEREDILQALREYGDMTPKELSVAVGRGYDNTRKLLLKMKKCNEVYKVGSMYTMCFSGDTGDTGDSGDTGDTGDTRLYRPKVSPVSPAHIKTGDTYEASKNAGSGQSVTGVTGVTGDMHKSGDTSGLGEKTAKSVTGVSVTGDTCGEVTPVTVWYAFLKDGSVNVIKGRNKGAALAFAVNNYGKDNVVGVAEPGTDEALRLEKKAGKVRR